ncbi:unnamed protein product [Peniophora sp. CBMAI 1063]|nr:unnamed protein product [Peniophora sp. CBMAI 1063]
MAAQNVNMATVLKRLEAVTSRLEDMYENARTGAPSSGPAIAAASATTGQAAPPPPPPPPPPAIAVADIEDPPAVKAFFEEIVDTKVKQFTKLTESFAAPSVIEQAKVVEKLYTGLGGLIRTAALCKKPTEQNAFAELLQALQTDINAISAIKEKNFKERTFANHLTFVAEGASAVGWVAIEGKPGPYVGEVRDASQFYGNRIIKEFKEKEPKHVEWVRLYLDILESMRKYIMAHHTTGLVWNPKGMSVADFKASSSASAAPAGGAPPPPPPPPPPTAPAAPPPPASGASPAGGIGAVFADLNKGSDVTKGLRKVDKSEMTHKNPALRASSTVPAASPPPSSTAAKPKKPVKPSALHAKKPPKFALEGNKWLVENQEGETLTIEETERSQVVNLYACTKTTVIIKGKINAITLFSCKSCSLLVDSVVSSISVTSSPGFAVQVTGSAPTFQLDSTDGGTIFLSKDSLATEITTAKCSNINVNLPVEGEEEGVFEEAPMPEMMLTKVVNGKLVTSIVEHAG